MSVWFQIGLLTRAAVKRLRRKVAEFSAKWYLSGELQRCNLQCLLREYWGVLRSTPSAELQLTSWIILFLRMFSTPRSADSLVLRKVCRWVTLHIFFTSFLEEMQSYRQKNPTTYIRLQLILNMLHKFFKYIAVQYIAVNYYIKVCRTIVYYMEMDGFNSESECKLPFCVS